MTSLKGLFRDSLTGSIQRLKPERTPAVLQEVAALNRPIKTKARVSTRIRRLFPLSKHSWSFTSLLERVTLLFDLAMVRVCWVSVCVCVCAEVCVCLQNLRVRTVGGTGLALSFGKLPGSLCSKYMLVDGDKVAFGSYR